MRSSIGDVSITIDYSRPHARGRVLLGNVIPYDRVWRTGANAATQFTTSAPVRLGGIQLSAGTYTLWTVPHPNGVDLIVSGQAGQWGTQYDRSRDVGTARMQSAALSTPVDQFTIAVAANDARYGTLTLEWGSFRWTAPIEVRRDNRICEGVGFLHNSTAFALQRSACFFPPPRDVHAFHDQPNHQDDFRDATDWYYDEP